ncbi:MAG TPA: hypothetical protein PL187_16280 [Caldilinea sp.]|nr:hypothetical protein [Anaerolineales bacterium]HRA67586.1 hypothetical protein [Caldilinea sp.]
MGANSSSRQERATPPPSPDAAQREVALRRRVLATLQEPPDQPTMTYSLPEDACTVASAGGDARLLTFCNTYGEGAMGKRILVRVHKQLPVLHLPG